MTTIAILLGAYTTTVTNTNNVTNRLLIISKEFPNLILDIERLELGITAGLQDRVIQTMGGVVFMDFTGMAAGSHVGSYTRVDPNLLPQLYIAYDQRVGTTFLAVWLFAVSCLFIYSGHLFG